MPSPADEAFQRAVAAMRAGKPNIAERSFQQVIQLQPGHVAALNLFGILLIQLGRYDEAEHHIRLALEENATSDSTFYNYGLVLKALKRPAEALEQFSRALGIDPSVAETWNNRGTVLSDLTRYDEAIEDFQKAIKINPGYPEAHYNKGKSLTSLKRWDEAFSAYDMALALRPNLAEAWLGRGNILFQLKRHGDAFVAYNEALALSPGLAEAWLGRGNVLIELARHDEAFSAYEKALALKPDLAEAWLGHANLLVELRRYDGALAAFDRALALEPDLNYVRGLRLHAKLNLSDWTDLDADVRALVSAVRNGEPATVPFQFLSVSTSPSDQLQCTRCFVADQPSFPPIWRGEIYSHDRIRIAYLSADFRNHAVAQLAVGLFERHDRLQFATTAISFGPDDGSQLRHRVMSAFDEFIDVRENSDAEVAELIRRHEIDIAVDLMGFTQFHRFNILARRAAPLQVNFLGYPGTMAADCIDYIVADPTVIPRDHFPFYSEQVVWLPDTYQANDAKRPISEPKPTRRECGLPETDFVFCCFNNAYKIAPEIFDIWMRLLGAKKSSVLWLLEPGSAAARNLRREAEYRGISPDRLIFAPRVAPADHLARSAQADLFLDTLPYNAHTTASEALWAGVPVLTCIGSTLAARVAASLLAAAGLAELATGSLQEYEALALKLADDRVYLASIKNKLARHRGSHPLFDTERFTRHIEAAYARMWARYQRGQTPESFAVDRIN